MILRFFLNEPPGKTWTHFNEMLPRLGNKFNLPIEVVSKPREAYQSLTYADLNLPKAPAIMLGGEVLVAGRDINEEELEGLIRQALATQG